MVLEINQQDQERHGAQIVKAQTLTLLLTFGLSIYHKTTQYYNITSLLHDVIHHTNIWYITPMKTSQDVLTQLQYVYTW